jgi:hypothetical protein
MKKTRAVLTLCIVVLVCMGCGRKLPPLPPGLPDPVEVISIRFDNDIVVAKIRCKEQGADVILLGKAKGICPACTDDLQKKDEQSSIEPGVIFLKDSSPDSDYMVYRVAFSKGSTSWMTQARIVRR